jgi:protein TonB
MVNEIVMKKYVLIFVTTMLLVGCSSSKSAVNKSSQSIIKDLVLTDPQEITKQPELIGGMKSIMSRISYPEKARKRNTQGRVVVTFIVKRDGKLTDFKVIKGIGNGCDEEAIRAVRKAKFKPGEINGEPVNVRFAIPIEFSLNRY